MLAHHASATGLALDRVRLQEMRDAFLSAVSHELRTPLTAVVGFAETLQRMESLSPDRRSFLLNRLVANAGRLERLLGDLLDVDRLSRGVLEPRYQPTDLAQLAARVVRETCVSARTVHVDARPSVAEVDPAIIERVVENLLANAARHTPEGSRIWVRTWPEQDQVLIAVEDDGPGVPPGLRSAVFQPFYRGPSAPTHAPGVGIGLALVARFAELHGGRVWVEERAGGGASFRVALPAHRHNQRTPAQARVAAA
ncbi:MAG: ATP-binding protein [Actinomycetota bacterium]